MIVLTLDQGLILEAPNFEAEIAYLFDQWQNQASSAHMEGAIQLNPMIWDELEEEFE